jgi:predicted dinucleotide-binding enzyme
MKIGIVGADDRAVGIARLLLRSGHKVTLSDPTGRGAARNAELALDHWAKASTVGEQALDSQALILAIHWQDVEDVLQMIGNHPRGIVIDATRPPRTGDGKSGAEFIARRLRSPHVIKGFVDVADPNEPIEIAGDDSQARMRVAEIIGQCGARVADRGSLANAAAIERGYIEKHTIP